jgi:hypothetical protein
LFFLYIRTDYSGRRFSQGCAQRTLAPNGAAGHGR